MSFKQNYQFLLKLQNLFWKCSSWDAVFVRMVHQKWSQTHYTFIQSNRRALSLLKIRINLPNYGYLTIITYSCFFKGIYIGPWKFNCQNNIHLASWRKKVSQILCMFVRSLCGTVASGGSWKAELRWTPDKAGTETRWSSCLSSLISSTSRYPMEKSWADAAAFLCIQVVKVFVCLRWRSWRASPRTCWWAVSSVRPKSCSPPCLRWWLWTSTTWEPSNSTWRWRGSKYNYLLLIFESEIIPFFKSFFLYSNIEKLNFNDVLCAEQIGVLTLTPSYKLLGSRLLKCSQCLFSSQYSWKLTPAC